MAETNPTAPAPARRRGISKKVRFEVFKRDGFKCAYCGAASPSVLLQIDHIEPIKLGGKNSMLNLVTACAGCNAGKSCRELSDESVVVKRRVQSEAEAELREQALAALSWQRSLLDRQREIARLAYAPLLDGTGLSLNEHGLQNAQNLISEVGVEDVVTAVGSCRELLRFSEDGAATTESVDEALANVPRRARWASACRREPNLRVAANLRSMVEHRMSIGVYRRRWLLDAIKAALDEGEDQGSLRRRLGTCRNRYDVEAVLGVAG